MKSKIKLITVTGIFTAIVYLLTAYLHIPSHTGYTHIGDGVIYLSACLLPLPYAAFVGGMGALLADCLSGFAVWAPASVIIKVAAVFFFTSRKEKIINTRNVLALIPASLICIGGYYLYDALIVGNFVSALAGIAGYITQSVLSSAFFIVLGLATDKSPLKNQIGEIKNDDNNLSC